jgi:uncharacterized protein (DUF362 family)/Pyruvate/2-oxoacid:ferredoxin oxidoreductase delta subunit
MPRVAIVKCENYSAPSVHEAINELFNLLELRKLIRPGQKVLLKPNLLMNFAPSKGVTTHPSVVKAIAEIVKECGAIPYLGDSPGGIGSMYRKVLQDTGMKDLGIPIADLGKKGMRKIENPGGKINPIFISNVALSFDLIINIPKLKTHELTRITCGIKNMFGCVPGLHKVNYHLSTPDPADFSKALVELFSRIRPAVTIVDAVVAMEGQGPSNGKLREIKKLIASTDTVAADAVCSKMMGFEPLEIATTRFADQMGVGTGRLEQIEIIGEPLQAIKNFMHPGSGKSMINRMPKVFLYMFKPLIDSIKIRPKINSKKCVKCMMCVKSCPAKAIDGKSFKINKNKCIMCFCCRELCRYNAVDLKESLLWKILSGTRKTPT